MTRLQIYVLAFAALLFMGLYWGSDTKPDKHKSVERSRNLAAESTDPQTLLQTAKAGLSPEQLAVIIAAEKDLDAQTEELQKVELLKKLSGSWYELGRVDLAGIYAEQVAEITNEESAWAIAGTTFTIGAKQTQENKIRQFCFGRAVKAYESAISINPSNSAHQLNLAICYTDNPPKSNPMKGILMLRDLNEKEPENTAVLTTLGRLAIQTGQYEKAVERLGQALTVEADNKQANCLLSKAYEGLGDREKAAQYAEKCR